MKLVAEVYGSKKDGGMEEVELTVSTDVGEEPESRNVYLDKYDYWISLDELERVVRLIKLL